MKRQGNRNVLALTATTLLLSACGAMQSTQFRYPASSGGTVDAHLPPTGLPGYSDPSKDPNKPTLFGLPGGGAGAPALHCDLTVTSNDVPPTIADAAHPGVTFYSGDVTAWALDATAGLTLTWTVPVAGDPKKPGRPETAIVDLSKPFTLDDNDLGTWEFDVKGVDPKTGAICTSAVKFKIGPKGDKPLKAPANPVDAGFDIRHVVVPAAPATGTLTFKLLGLGLDQTLNGEFSCSKGANFLNLKAWFLDGGLSISFDNPQDFVGSFCKITLKDKTGTKVTTRELAIGGNRYEWSADVSTATRCEYSFDNAVVATGANNVGLPQILKATRKGTAAGDFYIANALQNPGGKFQAAEPTPGNFWLEGALSPNDTDADRTAAGKTSQYFFDSKKYTYPDVGTNPAAIYVLRAYVMSGNSRVDCTVTNNTGAVLQFISVKKF